VLRSFATRLFDPTRYARRRPIRSRPTSFRPRLEDLEDRLVPAAWDYTNLVQTLGGYPAAHPTHLYLNFDGDGGNVAAFTGTQQDKQEILYRTAEIFAPFNVEVSRLTGRGNYDHGSAGNTTIFIGADASHVNGGVKYADGDTPMQYSDYPGAHIDLPFWNSSDHRPNSDAYDVAYVDPVFQDAAGGPMKTLSNDTISRYIAHEAGHTFGLVHVRTDGQTDPTPLGAGTVPDIMSYTGANQFFADQTLSVTAFNYHPEDGTNHLDNQPRWWSHKVLGVITATDPITTQDSFTFLRTVLGAHPNDGEHHASDPSTLDPSVQSAEIPQVATLSTATTASGTVSREGDFNVFRFETTAYQTVLRVDLAATQTSLTPFLQVYDSSGTLVASADSALNRASGFAEIHTTITVDPSSTYYFVVGGRDGVSQGTFHLKVSGRLSEAHDQSFTTRTGWALDVAAPGLQAADTDPDHNPMTTHLGRPPAHGTVTYLYSNGSFEYMPAHGFAGTDSFTYTEWDLNGQSNVATVTITVTPNALSAGTATYRVLFNQPLTTTTGNGLLAGYWDANARVPSVLPGSIHVTHGTLTLHADGTFTYRPNAGFRGTDTFSYKVTDGAATSLEGTVTLIVGAPPVATNLGYEVDAGKTLQVAAAQGLVGRNGDPAAVAHLVGPAPAGLTLHADGSFTFRAPPRRIYDPTPYTFRYYVTNPDGTSGIATVTITVYPQDPIVHGGHGQPF
jgi:hypothetical protein